MTDEGSVELRWPPSTDRCLQSEHWSTPASPPTRFLDVTSEEWDRIFAVNVRGSYNITGGSLRAWLSAVSVASSSCPQSQPRRRGIRCGGVLGGEGRGAGVRSALARELGPNGVTVNSVAPGFIETDISGGALTGERKEQLVAQIPVGRGGNVNDVADLITSSAARSRATSPASPTTSTAARTSTDAWR